MQVFLLSFSFLVLLLQSTAFPHLSKIARYGVSPNVLGMSPFTGGGKGKDNVVIDSDYKVAGGFWIATALAAKASIFAAVPFGLLAALLTKQTPRVRFVFDKDAMEVFIQNKDGSFGSRENFAVGGKNRWDYKSFKKWAFIPSKSLPIFMYFTESQTDPTKPDGQFHLFPVIMNSEQLYENLMRNVGEK